MVECPACSKEVPHNSINRHLDSSCTWLPTPPSSSTTSSSSFSSFSTASSNSKPIASIFQQKTPKRKLNELNTKSPLPAASSSKSVVIKSSPPPTSQPSSFSSPSNPQKRSFTESTTAESFSSSSTPKRQKPSGGSSALQNAKPLAERMRPQTLDEICGQELVGPNGVLRGLIEEGRIPSMILWGSAGCGKTTLARVIANTVNARFVEISATASGVGECKEVFKQAKSELMLTGRKTILFCDEIHRFTKSQQDIFLSPVESGLITLIGATTENPSFKLASALLSRCRTFTFAPLSPESLSTILSRALAKLYPPPSTPPPIITTDLLSYLATTSSGDARTALNLLDLSLSLSATTPNLTLSSLKQSLTRTLLYDRTGDHHYDHISAFHKSIRGSSPDGAIFYLARMLKSGEDPLFIARRMVVIASEDVGLADNSLLPLAVATLHAVQNVGMPEARINLAHCAIALALAPKSTRSYRALNKAMGLLDGDEAGGWKVPMHLRNAPTGLLKEMGAGKGYKYNPDYRDGEVVQSYLPEELEGTRFLEELDLGKEIDGELEERRRGELRGVPGWKDMGRVRERGGRKGK